MEILEAQQEIRRHFVGGFYGQLVSGAVWLGSSALSTWKSTTAGMVALLVGGFFIFPLTELLIRLEHRGPAISRENSLYQLGMQVAFVLPLSMPLLLPVVRYREAWFYPATMILVGAHYLPFAFMYGMRLFIALAAALLAGGFLTAMSVPASFAAGGWISGVILVVFAIAGRRIVAREGPW